MKSSKEQLEKRRYLSEDFDTDSSNLSCKEKQTLLKSEMPTDRTLAARLLKDEIDIKNTIDVLIRALISEKKLYTKIEISKTLRVYGIFAVIPLIKQLGKIGSNQHKIVPEKEFKKDNYPCPRDIASRILARIGKVALPDLLSALIKLETEQQSEAIDAIGFICFYDYTPNVYEVLKELYFQNSEKELIQWKILRAFSSFPESKALLMAEKSNLKNKRLGKEIDRSVSLISKRK